MLFQLTGSLLGIMFCAWNHANYIYKNKSSYIGWIKSQIIACICLTLYITKPQSQGNNVYEMNMK